jgi:epoxyqueuosine reductase
MTAENKNSNGADNAVQAVLAKLDVDMVGVARLDGIRGSRLEQQVLQLLPSARSIVVLGAEIWYDFLVFATPERVAGAANPNDLLERHLEYVRGRLARAVYDVAVASRKAGLKALPFAARGPSVDRRSLEAIISYKHAAEAAGLGRIGMSSLLITREFGPRLRLAVCLTEAPLEPTPGADPDICRYCNICVSKCPSGALGYPEKGERYSINRFACRDYIDAAGGCSECMKQCPIASPRYD